MRMLSELHRNLRAVSFVFVMAALGGCAAPTPNGNAHGADAPAGVEAAATKPTPAPSQAQTSPPAPKKPPHTGGPLPADPVEVPDSKPGGVDMSCKRDADCAVKNVGNCCGYYPACVNVNSPTDPKAVQAECARKGLMSVCGFPDISACTCNKGHCEAASGNLQVQ